MNNRSPRVPHLEPQWLSAPHELGWIEAVFENSPLGIIRVNLQLDITYANKQMLQMAGIDHWNGRNIREVVPDEANFSRITSQFAKRREGLSEQYEIEITRLDNRKRVPVAIAAMPVYGTDRKVAGAISVIQDISVERAIQDFDKHVERCSTSTDILREMSRQAEKVLPFDYCAASIYSRDMHWARVLFSYAPVIPYQPQTRWFPLGPYQAAMLAQRNVQIIDDLPSYFKDRGLQEGTNAPTEAFLRHGFRSLIRYPVFREHRLVASYAFCSAKCGLYTDRHSKILQALPIDSALITALHYEAKDELRFRFQLLRDLFSCRSNRELSGTLVKNIQAHYQWSNVALFDVDEVRRTFRLNNQKALSKHLLIPAKHTQTIDEGILGMAYRKQTPLYYGNVRTTEGAKDAFICGISSTTSELTIPIQSDQRVIAMLNVEDVRENAFSPEEVESLSALVREAGLVFERIRQDNYHRAAFSTTPSAIFLLDRSGVIRSANPAAFRLLGYEDGLCGQQLVDCFHDRRLGRAFISAKNPFSKEAILVRRDGTLVQVLIGGSQLGTDFEGERVVAAKDLQGHMRSEQAKFLSQMYYEIAAQYKTPLSLVFGWLRLLQQQVPQDQVDIIDKSLRQLSKVELTFDRLALFDKSKPQPTYAPRIIDLKVAIEEVVSELPKADAAKIVSTFTSNGKPTVIWGDSFQLGFVLRTILSYFIRCSSSDDSRIAVALSSGDRRTSVALTGPWTGLISTNHNRRASDTTLSRILWEMALGREIIGLFVGNHKGSIQETLETSNERTYRLEFPLADHEAAS